MIKMLSRFDLKPGIEREAFEKEYYEFVERAKQKGFVVSTDRIGERIADTPMDTDSEDAQRFYAVMMFRDKEQLDQAYDYMNGGTAHSDDAKPHNVLKYYVRNPVFTCWEE